MSAKPSQSGGERLEAILRRFVYSNPDNGWSVVRLEDPDGQEIAAVGPLLGVRESERLELLGDWVVDKKYGRQFKIESYRVLQPTSIEGIERYLASGLIPGIGKEMARRMTETFGTETLDVIDHQPERLTEVSGIGAKRSADIRESWDEHRGVRNLMLVLQEHGVATHLVLKIHRRYGAEALGIVKTNPYRLAREVHGIGFATADGIAGRLGLSKDAPERIEAGIIHLLRDAGRSGHVFRPRSTLTDEAIELLSSDRETVEAALNRLHRHGDLVLESLDSATSPDAATEPGSADAAVFPIALWEAETSLAEGIARLLAEPLAESDLDADQAVDWFESQEGITLAAEQREAIARALTAKVLVITGGPGTGKTTLVRGIVEILGREEQSIALAAPTGRAAKRLSEATGAAALTVHRLLGFDPGTGGFLHDESDPLGCDLLIVDEVSMLDTHLAASIVAALPSTARWVLVGDADQLPSVGPGRVLADLLDSGRVEIVRLREIFRQADTSSIVSNAHRILHGDMPQTEARANAGDNPGASGQDHGDFFFFERNDPEQALETIVHLVADRIPKGFDLDPVADVQVLTPMNRGTLGVYQLNQRLRDRLNPTRPGVKTLDRGPVGLRLGDKVMQIRNNYDLEVFNGDLGRVVAIDEDDEELISIFDHQEVAHPFADLDQLVLAYACSIHKSQGSEYPCVVIPIHTQHFVMLQRNLLYTAVTRGKQLVILVGQRRALGTALRNAKTKHRNTRLAERLRLG